MLKVMRTSLLTGLSPLGRCLLIGALLVINAFTPSVRASAVDSLPPAAPTGLTAKAIDGTVKLKWNANTETDLKAYSIFRGVDGAALTRLNVLPLVTEFTDETLAPGLHNVTYQISAFDSTGNESERSATIKLFTLDQTPPAAPTGLTAKAIDGNVKLTWNANTEKDLSFYSIFRGEEGATPVRLNVTIPRGATEFIDNTTGPGLRRYTYQLSAFDFSRNESARSAPVTLLTLDAIPPATPANFAATAASKKVVLTWTANTERDLSFYSIRKTVNGGPFTFMPGVPNTAASLTDTDVVNGSVYTYQISAFDFSRNESVRSVILTVTPQGEETLSVFPNPSTGPITIQLSEEKPATLIVRSLTSGALIYQGNYSQQSGINLDLGNVPQGPYILEVQQNGKVKSTRLQID